MNLCSKYTRALIFQISDRQMQEAALWRVCSHLQEEVDLGVEGLMQKMMRGEIAHLVVERKDSKDLNAKRKKIEILLALKDFHQAQIATDAFRAQEEREQADWLQKVRQRAQQTMNRCVFALSAAQTRAKQEIKTVHQQETRLREQLQRRHRDKQRVLHSMMHAKSGAATISHKSSTH